MSQQKMHNTKKNIKDLVGDEWEKIFLDLGMKKFTKDQVYKWIFSNDVSSFDQMTNVSKKDRLILEEKFNIDSLQIEDIQEDVDGTKKYLFVLQDGKKIEAVLIPTEEGRVTLCISSQVGCALGCDFCRTAELGFDRNLTVSEITEQIIQARRDISSKGMELTNIVFMGMGEPLNNFDNVKKSFQIMKDPCGLGLAKKRITISTAGIAPEIKRMKDEGLDAKLAVSLNATTDKLRRKLMPIAKRYSIDDIIDACLYFNPFGQRLWTTFEYILLDGVNDSLDDAKRLVKLMRRLPSKVNLIPFNEFPEAPYKRVSDKKMDQFFQVLYDGNIQTNIRRSRGQNILAACGQLAAKSNI